MYIFFKRLHLYFGNEIYTKHFRRYKLFLRIQDEIDWHHISEYQKLSEDFIREFKDRVTWYRISIEQKLSEEFIREFKDRVYWEEISKHQKLSEDFIREFKDRVHWLSIVYNQSYHRLSNNFIRENKHLF